MGNLRRRSIECTLVLLLAASGIIGGLVAVGPSSQGPESAGAAAPTPSAPAGTATAAPSEHSGTAGAGSSAPAYTPDPTAALTREDPASPSGVSMPVGAPQGWRPVFSDDFTEGDVSLGGFPGAAFGARWSANYADGTPDTAGQKNGGRSAYYPSKVLSVHDGVLDMYLHSENGISMGAAPAPKTRRNNGAPYNSQKYGLYSVRFRSDALPGFKVAWLLWPDSGRWPQDGEIDFPEGDLAVSPFAALHSAGSQQSAASAIFQTSASFQAWNTATIEWAPGRVEFFLNGQSIGVSTSGVPDGPMHYILQTESCLPTCPSPEVRGHVYVDWVAIWTRD